MILFINEGLKGSYIKITFVSSGWRGVIFGQLLRIT